MKLAYVISFVAIGMLFNVFGMKLDRKWLSNLGCLVMIAACVFMIADIVIAVLPQNRQYQGLIDGEVRTYSVCYKEHGYNVCEMPLSKNKVFVDDFWKK